MKTTLDPGVFIGYGLPPLTDRAAWEAHDALTADDRVVVRADEPPDIERRWRAYATRGSASPKLWMDAWLAAFAVAAGHRFVTTDAAFRQFADLDVLVLGETAS